MVLSLIWGAHKQGQSSCREKELHFPDHSTLMTEPKLFPSSVLVQPAADLVCRSSKSLGFVGVHEAHSSRGAEVCLVCSAVCVAMPWAHLAFPLIAVTLLATESCQVLFHLRNKTNTTSKHCRKAGGCRTLIPCPRVKIFFSKTHSQFCLLSVRVFLEGLFTCVLFISPVFLAPGPSYSAWYLPPKPLLSSLHYFSEFLTWAPA